jgi:hypothetical protein
VGVGGQHSKDPKSETTSRLLFSMKASSRAQANFIGAK